MWFKADVAHHCSKGWHKNKSSCSNSRWPGWTGTFTNILSYNEHFHCVPKLILSTLAFTLNMCINQRCSCRLPILCRCIAPGFAFMQLTPEQSMVVLANLTTLCLDLDPQVTKSSTTSTVMRTSLAKSTAAKGFPSRRVDRCSFGRKLWQQHQRGDYRCAGKRKHSLVSWAAFNDDTSRPASSPQHNGQFEWLEPRPSQRNHPCAAVVGNDAGSHWLFGWISSKEELVPAWPEGSLTFVASSPHFIR